MFRSPARGHRSRVASILLLGALVAGSLGVWASPAAAAATLTITPITWDVIGLDSNDVTTGPNRFPVGARVCNTGSSSATNVSATFAWTGAGTAALETDGPTTIALGTLGASDCEDAYYSVLVPRSTSNRTAPGTPRYRPYRITATADGGLSVATPLGRQLYSERLLSQGRNKTIAISGPGGCTAAPAGCDAPETNLVVGETYTYKLYAQTAPGGYEQLVTFISFPTGIFRVISASATYSNGWPAEADIYADACTWDPVPTSGTYLECTGDGKAGADIVLTYTVTPVDVGSGQVGSVILDYSGASFHYDADEEAGFVVTVTAPPDPGVLEVEKGAGLAEEGPFVPTLSVSEGTSVWYSLSVSNTGASELTEVMVEDSMGLPESCEAVPTTLAAGASWTCVYETVAEEGTTENVLTADSGETDPETATAVVTTEPIAPPPDTAATNDETILPLALIIGLLTALFAVTGLGIRRRSER